MPVGPALSRARGDMDLQDHKAYRKGTHRTVTPGETVARVRPLMAQMGITRVANVTGLDRIGVPVVVAFRPNSRSLAVSQGKGIDLDAAKASALMEAVEGYHAERIDHPLRLGSCEDLARALRLADVDGLPRPRHSGFHRNLQIAWIEGRDLLADTSVWLPYETVHTNYTLPLPTGSGCFVASTNGLASGNCLSEAISHGISEVVERDSITLWNHLPDRARDRTRIDIDTVDDATCAGVLDRLRRAGLAVAVWDATTDAGIPSFYCLIVDERRELAHSGAGSGTHPSREVALLRAVTEAVQVRTNYITGARDDLNPDEYADHGIQAKFDRAQALMRARPQRSFHDVPTFEAGEISADIDWMLGRLTTVGVKQVIVVDLSRPEFNLAVARVVIPGLEGPDDHEAYAPGPRARAVGGDAS